MDEERSKTICEEIFAEELDGHRLVANRSIWRQFPKIWNERWWYGKCVLVGDALRTAHFSIGSGTRLAMERELDARIGALETNVCFLYNETIRRSICVSQHKFGRPIVVATVDCCLL
jgi:hypothetical protein